MTKDIVPNFVQFESDGLEFVIETTKGLAYASKRATARMLGVDEKTVRNEIEGADYFIVTNAKIETSGGIQGADLIPADVVFDLALKFNPELAKQMGKAGANLYMLNAAGYKIEVKESEQQTEVADPATLGEHFYAWDDRKTPKIRWQLDKLSKRNKGKIIWRLRQDVPGLCLLDFFNATTGDRIYTLFAYLENVATVAEIRKLVVNSVTTGAKLMGS